MLVLFSPSTCVLLGGHFELRGPPYLDPAVHFGFLSRQVSTHCSKNVKVDDGGDMWLHLDIVCLLKRQLIIGWYPAVCHVNRT